MKFLKFSSAALVLVLILTGYSEKKDDNSNIQDDIEKNTPYQIDITDQRLRVYDGEGNLVADDVIEKTKGYNIEQNDEIISVELKNENENSYMIINGKKSGKAELTIYDFSLDDNECTGKASYTFMVDSNLNVRVSDLSGNYGFCDQSINNVTVRTKVKKQVFSLHNLTVMFFCFIDFVTYLLHRLKFR